MRKWIVLSLVISWHECGAHPKDGVFVEGGLMTGMLKSVEYIQHNPFCGPSILCTEAIMQNASPLFTTSDVTSPITRFSTTAPVKITLGSKGLQIENFLPYTLSNIDIYMQTPQGQVKVASVQSLPKFTQTYVNPNLLGALANAPADAQFSVKPTPQSDPTTTRVLDALSQISVDLNLSFAKAPDAKWLTPTPKQAEELTDAMLNLTALLSSKAFGDAVLNAPFPFYNTSSGQPVISPQKVLETYRAKANLQLGILSPKAGESRIAGLGGPGILGVQPYLINPKSASIWTNYQNGSALPMEVILHEFGHTKNYGHDGNMTYGKNGTGLVELGIKAWKQLGETNQLPINYDQIAHVPNPIYNSSFVRALSNALPSGGTSADAMVGFDLKSGYQQYFNDVVGLAYYGILKYNFSKRMGYIKTISQVGLGVGTDLLLDFKTTYKTQRTRKHRATHLANKSLKSAFGSFIGLRALWDSYVLNSIYKSAGNLNAVVGFNYRFEHSKYSLGVSIPLIQNPLKFGIHSKNLTGNMVLYDGASHFNVFFNYGWVF
ncbi:MULTISPECIES: porin family protein [Helicobacter]|uniref:hypothetical protein n=1 Tax=Helicobacter TaxID=209 RepID=UPI0013CE039A|nr:MULTISPECIES: hypothetical protein [Helicobacter]